LGTGVLVDLDSQADQGAVATLSSQIQQASGHLPDKFTRDLYKQKCDIIYQDLYDNYFGEGRSVYTRVEAA
jgi:type I restriction enzyme, R subunit